MKIQSLPTQKKYVTNSLAHVKNNLTGITFDSIRMMPHIDNPHGFSGIYGIREWPCRKKKRLPKERKMTKSQKEREFMICMMKVEVEVSKRKMKTMLDEFLIRTVKQTIETI